MGYLHLIIADSSDLQKDTGKRALEDQSLCKKFPAHMFYAFRVDKLTIPSRMGKGELHRVTEVFDCWFESGSMPYAQQHYPFQHKKEFDDSFPADFIAEGIDQTRGW